MKSNIKKILFLCIMLALLTIPLSVNAKKDDKQKIYMFYGDGCPHCKAEEEYLDKILKKEKYSNYELEKYEVWYNSENAKKADEVGDILEVPATSIPYLIIGTNVVIGYNSSYDYKITVLLDFYKNKEYQDPAGDYLHNKNTKDLDYLHYDSTNDEYDVPVLGKIDAKSVSLLLLSIVIGTIDGFNPCAMWILLFLLSLLISTKDRKKMWILGLTFILTSGFIYLCFMLSWLSVAKYTTGIIFVRYLIGVFAIIFGLVNVFRYIKSVKQKDVGCDVTDAKKKRRIMDKIRNILSENKLLLAAIGIALLAVSVNMIELLCSLGLPVMYTEILGLNNLSSFEYGFYIFIYMLFFLIDDLIVFFIAMKTFKVKGISNKYMKYSHLIGGIIMLLIGIIMVVKPNWIMLNF